MQVSKKYLGDALKLGKSLEKDSDFITLTNDEFRKLPEEQKESISKCGMFIGKDTISYLKSK